MSDSEERARFCGSCNAVVGWYATHCDSCGRPLGAAAGRKQAVTEPEPARVDGVQDFEADLFKAQMRLIQRSQQRAQSLGRAIDTETRRVESLLTRARGAHLKRELVSASERVLALEQEWEDVQSQHNRQSESLEEEFLTRIQELETDLELAPERQGTLEKEARTFVVSLEASQERLTRLGRSIDLASAREASRFLGVTLPARRLGLIACLIPVAGLGLGAFMGVQEGLEPRVLALVLGPVLAALALAGILMALRARD